VAFAEKAKAFGGSLTRKCWPRKGQNTNSAGKCLIEIERNSTGPVCLLMLVATALKIVVTILEAGANA
jgi:hypothetical protein